MVCIPATYSDIDVCSASISRANRPTRSLIITSSSPFLIHKGMRHPIARNTTSNNIAALKDFY